MKINQLLIDDDVEVIEIFRTNISTIEEACQAVRLLDQHFGYSANVDLQDCDRILRVRGVGVMKAERVIGLLSEHGFCVDILPDELPAIALNEHEISKIVN